MPTLREQIETTLPADEAFAFVADFANSMVWDPGVAASVRLDEGPLKVGARYRLSVRLGRRVAPMEYTITELDAPRRVVLAGRGSGVEALDDIRFEATPTGTLIDYTADIRLVGLLRLLQPFLGGAFAEVGRKAAGGMRRALSEMEAEREASSAGHER
jgi:carbon monoxide dehydrogenase subunit G